jgi:hypothetical protein
MLIVQDTQRWAKKHDKVTSAFFSNVGEDIGFTEPALSAFVDLMKGSPVELVSLMLFDIATVTD